MATILLTLSTMGWLGIVLGILVFVNVITSTFTNVWTGKEFFSWSRLGKGLLKAVIFYICAVLVSVAFTMLPFINTMITNIFGVMMLSNDSLEVLSAVGVIGTVVTSIVAQGKKALEGISKLSLLSTNSEEITWDVEDE